MVVQMSVARMTIGLKIIGKQTHHGVVLGLDIAAHGVSSVDQILSTFWIETCTARFAI